MSKKGLVLLTLSLCLLLLWALPGHSDEITADTSLDPLTTLLLTDRDNTFYRAERPTLLADSIGSHVLWTENVGFFDDSDLFYAYLPGGAVHRLSDRTATVGLVGTYTAVLADSSRLYVAWNEDVGAPEGDDIFFWKSGMNAPLNISDHTLSNGNASRQHLVIDANQQAHVLWAEADFMGSFGVRIFYWSEATGVTRKLSSGTSNQVGFNVVYPGVFVVYGNTVHALWRDSTATGVRLFYWNSATDTTIPITPHGSPTLGGRYHLDNNGVLHVLWLGDMYYYWNSTSNNNLPLGTLYPSLFILDGNNNAHLYYSTNDGVYHWNTVTQTAAPIPGLTDTSDIIARGNGRIGDHFHLLWRNTDAAFPEHLNDLFYWRSDQAQPTNITDHSLAPANPANIIMLVDETDAAHILWKEPTPLYYNSHNQQTLQLTAVLNNLTIQQAVAAEGIAYAQFLDAYSASPPFYIWQSDTNTATPVAAHLKQAQMPSQQVASASTIWLDSDDVLHLAFTHGATFNHWDTLRGFQDLTADSHMEPVINEGQILSTTDAWGGSYLIWQGETVISNGSDMYAAFVRPNPPYAVYLPLITR